MAGPIGHPNNQGNGLDQMKAQIISWIRAEIANAARGGIGLHVDGATGNLIVDQGNAQSQSYVPGSAGWVLQPTGSAEFNGNVNVTGTETVSGNLNVTGSETVSGNLTVSGTLVLPNASVNNSALVSPVTGGSSSASTTGFALSTTLTELAGIDITVPAGFTQAYGTIGAYVFSYNPNTTGGSNGVGGDAIYAQARIGTTQSRANPIGVSGSGGFATSSSGTGYGLTGLTPGGTIRLSVYGSSAYAAIASNINNYANAFASIIWLR